MVELCGVVLGTDRLLSLPALRPADQLAVWAHQGQCDRFGDPYIEHPRRVATALLGLTDLDGIVAALLHDSVEKGRATYADLRRAGIGPAVIDLVEVLTRRPGQDLGEYLERCARLPVTRRIKRADLLDKVRPLSLARLGPEAAALWRTRIEDRLAVLAAATVA